MATPLPIQPYLNKDRVVNLTDSEFCICPLCEGVLWLPKGCQNCDTPYCSSCIKNRQLESAEPIQCPSQTCSESTALKCSGFIQYRCSNLVIHALSKLTVKCRYEVHGCKEIPPYDHLETHEKICVYQQKTCSGCENNFALKDFKAHESTCPLVILNCPECNTKYKRQDQDKHTETKCLREQLFQVRAIGDTEIKSLREQLHDLGAIGDTETKCLHEQLFQVRATGDTEIKSLREQLHDLGARITHLENQKDFSTTEPNNSNAQNSNEPEITEVPATSS